VRGDTIVEYAGEGTDRVLTTLNAYVLPANVEQLIFKGTGNFSATGNGLDNLIIGGSGDDYIDSMGGSSNLYGGQGNDTYYVRSRYEAITEAPSEGTDTMVALYHDSYVMAPNVENFVSRTYFSVGVTGNALDNVIVGTAEQTYYYLPSGGPFPNPGNTLSGGGGNDTIVGGAAADTLQGGDGMDLLTGGGGADDFRYQGGETGLDRILDFTPGIDKIALANAGFAHTATIAFIATGAPVAMSSNSTFLYDVNTGILSYDADGNGAGAAVQLSQLNTGLTLTTGDFIFV
jgi:Ca2+-binding RTX toxin-like protein